MIGKIHRLDDGKVLFACCDKELLNKEINDEETSIFFSEKFFGKKEVNEKDIIESIKLCDSANVFGKKICDFLLKEKIIEKVQIIMIKDIPHVQIYFI